MNQPTHPRKTTATPSGADQVSDTMMRQLRCHSPYDWDAMLNFLRARMIRNVECVTDDSYSRTVRLGRHAGWIRVAHTPGKNSLTVTLTRTLAPVLPAILARLRNLFDLSARPDLIATHLRKDPRLRQSLKKNPGLRVPGAFDGFEMAVRAVLGQQITVAGATTIAGRFVEAFGAKIETPFSELTRLTPLPGRVARASVDKIAQLGIVRARSECLLAMARALESGTLNLDAGVDPDAAIQRLMTLRGIGPWTAHYIAMRALHWPDAFPKEDLAIRNNLGGVSARQAGEISRAWQPWRSYAVMHIWKNPPQANTP